MLYVNITLANANNLVAGGRGGGGGGGRGRHCTYQMGCSELNWRLQVLLRYKVGDLNFYHCLTDL